jgi:hypothetical protein
VRLSRSDAATFTPEEVEKVLEPIRHCLSFSQGYWCPIILPIGYDASGSVVWQKHGEIRAEPYRCTMSILGGDPLPNAHRKLLECSCQKWKEPGWAETLHEVVYWYLAANSAAGGIEAAIIITQTAIERLVFESLVNQSAKLSRCKFDKLHADERVRDGILAISPESSQALAATFAEIQGLVSGAPWKDTEDAITHIRNLFVHPQKKGRGDFDAAHGKAWEVGLWILEQLVMRMVDYNGLYYNRLRSSGAAVPVPWTTGDDAAKWLGIDLNTAGRLKRQ